MMTEEGCVCAYPNEVVEDFVQAIYDIQILILIASGLKFKVRGGRSSSAPAAQVPNSARI